MKCPLLCEKKGETRGVCGEGLLHCWAATGGEEKELEIGDVKERLDFREETEAGDAGICEAVSSARPGAMTACKVLAESRETEEEIDEE